VTSSWFLLSTSKANVQVRSPTSSFHMTTNSHVAQNSGPAECYALVHALYVPHMVWAYCRSIFMSLDQSPWRTCSREQETVFQWFLEQPMGLHGSGTL